MALIFPPSPSLGDTYTDPTSGVTYVAVKGGTPAEWVSSADSGSSSGGGGFDFDELSGVPNFAAISSGYPSVAAVNGVFVQMKPEHWGHSVITNVPQAYPDHAVMPTQNGLVTSTPIVAGRELFDITFNRSKDDSAIIFNNVILGTNLIVKGDNLGMPAGQSGKGPKIISGAYMQCHNSFDSPQGKVGYRARAITAPDTEILDNCVLFGPFVNLVMESLVDTTTCFIACGLGRAAGSNSSQPAIGITIKNAALNAASVSKILVDCDSIDYYVQPHAPDMPKTVTLDGGTSAGVGALTTEGAAARTSLLAKGFTLVLNP